VCLTDALTVMPGASGMRCSTATTCSVAPKLRIAVAAVRGRTLSMPVTNASASASLGHRISSTSAPGFFQSISTQPGSSGSWTLTFSFAAEHLQRRQVRILRHIGPLRRRPPAGLPAAASPRRGPACPHLWPRRQPRRALALAGKGGLAPGSREPRRTPASGEAGAQTPTCASLPPCSRPRGASLAVGPAIADAARPRPRLRAAVLPNAGRLRGMFVLPVSPGDGCQAGSGRPRSPHRGLRRRCRMIACGVLRIASDLPMQADRRPL